MDDLREKLDCPIVYCISSSDTYKNLLDHMVKDTNMYQSLNKMYFFKCVCCVFFVCCKFPVLLCLSYLFTSEALCLNVDMTDLLYPGGLPGC